MRSPTFSRARRRPQLWSSCRAQPSRLAPCQRQEAEKSCTCLLDAEAGWTPGAGARPGLLSALCGKDCTGELWGALSALAVWRAVGVRGEERALGGSLETWFPICETRNIY